MTEIELEAELVDARVRELLIEREARRRADQVSSGQRVPGQTSFDAGTLAEVLARPPGPEPRVRTLIPARASTLVVAKRKVGKTTFLLNLAHDLLQGELFLEELAVEPVTGKIAFLNYELDGQMLATWASEMGIPHEPLFLVNLRGARNPLGDRDERARLAGMLQEQGAEMLVVDTFSRAFGGSSQNDAGEVSRFLTDLDHFAREEVGAQDLVLTAHAGWNGERSRGSSALEDWADSIITITNDKNQRFISAFGRDVDLEEDRVEYDDRTRRLRLTNSGGRRQFAEAIKASELVQPVIEAVRRDPGLNGTRLEAALRREPNHLTFQKGMAAKAARLAVKQGDLREEQGRGRGGGSLFFPNPGA